MTTDIAKPTGTSKRTSRARRLLIALALMLCATLAALCCGCAQEEESTADVQEDEQAAQPSEESEAPASEPVSAQDRARSVMDGMTLEEKILQMFIVEPEQLTGVGTVIQAGETTKEALEAWPVGGLIYNTANLIDAGQTTEMLSNTLSYAKYGMFLCIDEEGGSQVARIANNSGFVVDQVPDMYTIGESGDVEQARQAGATISWYLSEFGFNLDFAPVADVLTNPDNTAIGIRSFGSDPTVDADMTTAFVDGLQGGGVASTLKHFPGHGGTSGDSHDDAVSNDRTLDELRSCEFVPFQAGIDAGASCVMVGHIALPAVTGDDVPATLSPTIVNGLLRDELGFDGVVITDSMNMGAITNYYTSGDAAVRAIEAGCDIILMPENLQEAYQGVLDAVTTGTITEERIDESVMRILSCKAQYGII